MRAADNPRRDDRVDQNKHQKEQKKQHKSADPAPRDELPESKMRRGMRVGIVEGVLASASDHLAGPYPSLYALSLGASHTQIGLVSAVPALMGTLLQLPSAWFAEKIKKRKLLTVIGGMGLRAMWLPIALIPMFRVSPDGAVTLFILLLALRSAIGAVGTPAWTSLMADITPRRVRGKYFGNRNILLTLAALGAAVVSGLILKLFSGTAGYQIAFGLSALFGIAASVSFVRFPDVDAIVAREPRERASQPEPEKPLVMDGPGRDKTEVDGKDASAHAPALRVLRHPWRAARSFFHQQRAFAMFATMSLIWNFGVHLPQPLFAVHFVEALGGSAGFWAVVTGATSVTTVFGQRYWAPLADRFGGRNVMVASGILPMIIPLLWLGAFRPEHGVVINLISGFGWAGYNLAAFNLLLEMTPDDRRMVYVAGYNSLIGVSQFAGPFLGGVMADWMSVQWVFAFSTGLRVIGWILLVTVVRTAFDTQFTWRDYIRTPRMGGRRLFGAIAHFPQSITGRVRARRQAKEMRRKLIARHIARSGSTSPEARRRNIEHRSDEDVGS